MRKRARKVDSDYLERAALYYLERYASSAANLRRVLMRKVQRSVREHGTERGQAAQWVDELIQRLQARKILDDRVYAEGRSVSLSRQGKSQSFIAMTLAAKGVPTGDIEAGLAALAEARPQADLAAALAVARKRGFGPYRKPGAIPDRNKELAALARRGFSLEIARKVVDATGPEPIEAMLGPADISP